jgi:hypothetical protein
VCPSYIKDARFLKVKALDFRLRPLPSAAISTALHTSHTVSAFVDVGVDFAARAAAVVAVGLLRIYGVYISVSV